MATRPDPAIDEDQAAADGPPRDLYEKVALAIGTAAAWAGCHYWLIPHLTGHYWHVVR